MIHSFTKEVITKKLITQLQNNNIISCDSKLKFEFDEVGNVEYLAIDLIQIYFMEVGTEISFYADYGPIIFIYNEEDRLWNDEDVDGMVVYEGEVSSLSIDSYFELIISFIKLLYKAESVFVESKNKENQDNDGWYHKENYKIYLQNNGIENKLNLANIDFYINYKNLIAEYKNDLHVSIDNSTYTDIYGSQFVNAVKIHDNYALHYDELALYSKIENYFRGREVSFNLYNENRSYVLCFEGRNGKFNVFFGERIIVLLFHDCYIVFKDNVEDIELPDLTNEKVVFAGIDSKLKIIKMGCWEKSILGIDIYDPNIDDVIHCVDILLDSEIIDVKIEESKYRVLLKNNNETNNIEIGNIIFTFNHS